MKLYFSKGACSLAVRILLNELNIPCEYESVNLAKKQTETGQDYKEINPKGAVPALQLDNGEILTENMAIQQFLVDKKHATQLLPDAPDFKRYRAIEWFSFITSDLHKTASALFNHDLPQEIKDKYFLPIFKSKLKVFDDHLANSKYLLGEEYMLPDGYLFVILLWIKAFKLDLKDWKNLARFVGDMKDREAVKKSLKEEGINLH